MASAVPGLLALAALGFAGCDGASTTPLPLGGGGADAGPPLALPPPRPPVLDTVEVGRFRVVLEPRAGRWTIEPIATRINYDVSGAPTSWSVCGASCLPPAGTAALWTAQTGVTFMDFDGVTCYGNGAVIACPKNAPCNEPGVFCAPLQLVSNVQSAGGGRGALPDPIIQLSQQNDGANFVLGCRDDDLGGYGLCAGSGKVDAPSSNLTSPIPGDPGETPPTFGCSYCYGNLHTAQVTGFPGLAQTLLSGNDASLLETNTDIVAMRLKSSADYDVTITVRQAKPALDVPASQLQLWEGSGPVDCASTNQTTVIVNGGGFGPPGACLAANLQACPDSGPPAPGYQIFMSSTAGDVPATSVSWSDSQISATFPPGARSGVVKIVTPQAPGGLVTTAHLQQCIHAAKGPYLVGGAGAVSDGALTGHIEVGRGLRPTIATDGPLTMRIETVVTP